MTRTTIGGSLMAACLGGCPTVTPDATQGSSPITPGTYIGVIECNTNGERFTEGQSVEIAEDGGLTYFGNPYFEGAVFAYRDAEGAIDEIETIGNISRTNDSILVNSTSTYPNNANATVIHSLLFRWIDANMIEFSDNSTLFNSATGEQVNQSCSAIFRR